MKFSKSKYPSYCEDRQRKIYTFGKSKFPNVKTIFIIVYFTEHHLTLMYHNTKSAVMDGYFGHSLPGPTFNLFALMKSLNFEDSKKKILSCNFVVTS